MRRSGWSLNRAGRKLFRWHGVRVADDMCQVTLSVTVTNDQITDGKIINVRCQLKNVKLLESKNDSVINVIKSDDKMSK